MVPFAGMDANVACKVTTGRECTTTLGARKLLWFATACELKSVGRRGKLDEDDVRMWRIRKM